ncbi:MAG: Uma2 family endonuclease [Candidatus Binatia bacterium]
MGLPLRVTTASGAEAREPYLLRVGGWTEARYFAEAPETRLVEFEEGEVIMHSPAGTRHQRLVGLVSFVLTGYVARHRLGTVLNGPAVVRLRPGLDYEPDIFFVPQADLGRLGEQYFAGAPALVVEIVSAGTRHHDLHTKAANYQRHRVKEYWAVDVQKRALIRHQRAGRATAPYRVTRHAKGRVASTAIPGFWLEASWLWRQPLPPELECLERILGSGRT